MPNLLLSYGTANRVFHSQLTRSPPFFTFAAVTSNEIFATIRSDVCGGSNRGPSDDVPIELYRKVFLSEERARGVRRHTGRKHFVRSRAYRGPRIARV